MGMKKPSETQLVRACLDLLHLHRIPAWRNNSGAWKVGNRFVRFGEKGSADILGVLPGGRLLACECKLPGKLPTEAQSAWLERVRQAGALACVVTSVKELEDVLRDHGVIL
jgi:hypothetical protein